MSRRLSWTRSPDCAIVKASLYGQPIGDTGCLFSPYGGLGLAVLHVQGECCRRLRWPETRRVGQPTPIWPLAGGDVAALGLRKPRFGVILASTMLGAARLPPPHVPRNREGLERLPPCVALALQDAWDQEYRIWKALPWWLRTWISSRALCIGIVTLALATIV